MWNWYWPAIIILLRAGKPVAAKHRGVSSSVFSRLWLALTWASHCFKGIEIATASLQPRHIGFFQISNTPHTLKHTRRLQSLAAARVGYTTRNILWWLVTVNRYLWWLGHLLWKDIRQWSVLAWARQRWWAPLKVDRCWLRFDDKVVSTWSKSLWQTNRTYQKMTWAGTGTSIKQMRLSLSAAAAPSPQAGARSHSWPLIVQSATSSSSISCSKARKDDMSASVVPFPLSLGISRMTLSRSLFQAQVLRCSSSPAEQSWSFIDGQRWSEFHSCHYYQSFTGWKSFPKQQSSTSSWWSSLSVSLLLIFTSHHFRYPNVSQWEPGSCEPCGVTWCSAHTAITSKSIASPQQQCMLFDASFAKQQKHRSIHSGRKQQFKELVTTTKKRK